MKKVKKKMKLSLGRCTEWISWFLGSWWGVVFHTSWFTIWLILDFDINLLTFSVSLEAIFIGIFLLMASGRAEEKRDLRETRQRESDRKKLEYDIKLDEKADRQLTEIKRAQKEMATQIDEVKKMVKKIQK